LPANEDQVADLQAALDELALIAGDQNKS